MAERSKNFTCSSQPYVSCIVIKGRPILPPVMTPSVYEEMRRYKSLAIEAERKRQHRNEANKRKSSTAEPRTAALLIKHKDGQNDNQAERVGTAYVEPVISSTVTTKSPIPTLEIKELDRKQQLSDDSVHCRTSASQNLPERNTPGMDWSTTPPSVASTDLAKYMTADTDLEDQVSSGSHVVGLEDQSTVADMGSSVDLYQSYDSDSCHLEMAGSPSMAASGRSSMATVIPDDRQNSHDVSLNGDHQLQPDIPESSMKHIRRSSYTLERPSPILVAHFQKLQQSSVKIELPSIKINGMAINGNKSQSAEKNATVDDEDVRREHLQRYLNQMAPFTVCSTNFELPLSSRCNLINENQLNSNFVDANSSALRSELEIRSEDFIQQQQQRFHKLKEELEESRQQQLSRLKLLDANLNVGKSSSQSETRELLRVEKQITGLSMQTSLPENRKAMFSPSHRSVQSPSQKDSSQGPNVVTNHVSNSTSESTAPKKVLGSPSQIRAIKLPSFQFPFRFKPFHTGVEHVRGEVIPPAQVFDTEMKLKFNRLSAAVKGYLTRRLMRTQKVQAIIKTIQDTLEFAFQLHSETPLKQRRVTPQDASLHQRLIAQLSSACYEFHDIFFKLTTKEKMKLISQDRALQQEKLTKDGTTEKWNSASKQKHRLSSATLKAMERKRHRITSSRQSAKPPSPYFGRGRSPRDENARKAYQQMLSGNAVRARTASPRMQHRLELGISQNVGRGETPIPEPPLAHHRVRRSLYGQQPIVKAKSKTGAGRPRPSGTRSAR